MTDKTSGVLAAIVNLDEEQLRTVDDDGSYGTSADIADGTPVKQIRKMDDEVDRVSRDAERTAAVDEFDCQPSSFVPEAPQYYAAQEPSSTAPYGSRRTRIKNAIFSKWKTNRLNPKRRQADNNEEGDIEASYVSMDDTNSPGRSMSQMSVSTPTAKDRKSQSSADHQSSDLLGLEHQSTVSSFNNGPLDPPPPQLALSSELFHWYIHRSWKKKLLTILVVASSAIVLYDILFCQGWRSQAVVDRFLDWMRLHPVLGIYGYIGVLAVTSLVYIPPSPLIISSGFIFRSIYGPFSGPLLALISSYVGAVVGGSIGFIRANYMTRDLIRILMRRYPLLRAIDAAVVRNSLRVMILLRLNPLIPFGVLNYLFGISGVSGPSFVLGVIGVVPWHLWLISVGASANSLIYDDDNAILFRIILLGMGTVCGVIGLVITWKFAKKELQKEMNSQAVINDFRIQDPNLSPQRTPRRNDNEIEEADLEFGDCMRMQLWGMDVDGAVEVEEEDYRSKLDWELCILDDFS